MPQLLKRLQLGHGQVTVDSTPRRLGILIAAVQARQADVEESVRGPPAKVRLSLITFLGNAREAKFPAHVMNAHDEAMSALLCCQGAVYVGVWREIT